MAGGSVKRIDAITKLVEGLKATYPDAKKFSIDIDFEWVETDEIGIEAELCPRVKIDIER